MNNRAKKSPPMAAWSGTTGKVRLVLPYYRAADLHAMLEDFSRLPAVRISTSTGVARMAAKSLATEMLTRRAIVVSNALQTDLRMTVPQSEALTLLAWLVVSDRTADAAAPLRLLIDALYRLLS
jgi:hypothetical protein